MTEEAEKFYRGIMQSDLHELQIIVGAAICLERVLYAGEDYKPDLYKLRKALENIWGHDLPKIEHKDVL